ncbi:FAD-dependent monooxygenase [Nocardiopsis potens]|uniref:FAD-dependent monooxygenase n=1 Tax=Nocardiopsis potens TaxID=1246458 RepID=UPI000346804C|nr:FAD-dependent monooxygenase [Nocardiopsis potens]
MPESETALDVLVIGAGPSGLTLAADLARRGVRCRVVDRRPEPLPGARCPNLWRRTLYALDRVGLDPEALRADSVEMRAKVFHVGGESVSVPLREDPDDDRWPFPLLVRQDRQEEMLSALAERHGCPVRRGTEASLLARERDSVLVGLRSESGEERVRAAWVVAADGEDGPTRRAAGAAWTSRPHGDITWWQLDTGIEGLDLPPAQEDLFHAPRRHVGLVPLAGGRYRLFLAAPAAEAPAAPGTAEVEEAVRGILGDGVRLTAPEHLWRRTPLQGNADRWVLGRVLLLGDAARVFPMPVHGLNTGIQDAADLGWKLAAVVRGDASPALLETYETERRGIAEVLMRRGEHVLRAGVSEDPAAALAPILRERRPRVRTEPAGSYETGPLTLQARHSLSDCAGDWIAPARVAAPEGARTVADLQRDGRWLVLSPPGAALRVEHPLDPLTVEDARPERSGRVLVVRPDGYVGAEIPLSGERAAAQDVRSYLDLVASGGSRRAAAGPAPRAAARG